MFDISTNFWNASTEKGRANMEILAGPEIRSATVTSPFIA
jgi:hypothetical protein